MNDHTTELKRHLSRLFVESLRLSSPLYQLEMIRQKLEGRELLAFDQEDILGELGSLQHTLGALNSEMLRIHELLTRQG